MSIPLDKKVPMLNNFHTFLYQDDWRFTESQEKDRQVLDDFPTVSSSTCSWIEWELRMRLMEVFTHYFLFYFLQSRYHWSSET